MNRPAVFLDRDGTIIEDAGYIGDPQQVRLIPDAAEAIRRFRRAGCLVVIVSNQSGVARGYFDTAAMKSVHARVEALLSQHGATVDRAYYCPFLDGPEAAVEAYRRDSDLRKPRPGMLRLAAKELEIDLSHSWMIGDSPTDVQAGARAGCRTIFLDHDGAPAVEPAPTHRVKSLAEASQLVEQAMQRKKNSTPTTPFPIQEESGSEGKKSSSPSKRENRAESQSPSDLPAASSLQPDVQGESETSGDAILHALDRIHDQLERAHRKERQHDFSFLRLFAALLQMLAIVTALWGVVALMDDQSASASARLTLACFFQVAALSAFAVDRFR